MLQIYDNFTIVHKTMEFLAFRLLIRFFQKPDDEKHFLRMPINKELARSLRG